MDREGIVVAAPAVGLVIADASMPQVSAALKRAHEVSPFRHNAGACRELVCQSPRGTCHLLSVVEWDSQSHTATFYVPAELAQAFSGSASTWTALLIRTDSWSALTASAAMASSVRGDDDIDDLH